jgi:prephenate dehydrogenase
MAEISIAILGLKRVGASIGLALKRHNAKNSGNTFIIGGYDTSRDIAKEAQQMGAVDKIEHDLDTLVRDRDIVVIALPIGEVEGAYENIAHALRTGVVVIDMSPLAQSALKVAEKHLPEGAHVVCAAPIFNPKYLFDGTDEVARASEDLFDKGTIMVMPSVTCIKEAISLASDFAALLGATPNFYDPAEYDSLTAATEGLPSLLGVVTFHLLSRSEGWADIQRLTNPGFGMLTRHLFDTHPDDLRDFWLTSGPALLRQVDELVEGLRSFRALLAEQDHDSLAAALETASSEYEGWINRRMTNRWKDGRDDKPLPTQGIMGNMFGRWGRKDDD